MKNHGRFVLGIVSLVVLFSLILMARAEPSNAEKAPTDIKRYVNRLHGFEFDYIASGDVSEAIEEFDRMPLLKHPSQPVVVVYPSKVHSPYCEAIVRVVIDEGPCDFSGATKSARPVAGQPAYSFRYSLSGMEKSELARRRWGPT